MTLWFRFYTEALDDPKVQSLPPELFKAWVNCLCIAAKHDGYLPPDDAISFHLRVPIETVNAFQKAFHERGLVDQVKHGWKMHGWDKRQFKSDTSTDRVKRFRKRFSNVGGNAPEAETDTETERTPLRPPKGGRKREKLLDRILREAREGTDDGKTGQSEGSDHDAAGGVSGNSVVAQ